MKRIWIGALALAACTEEGVNTDIEGRQAFLQDCASCHGPDGKGGGPMAASLDPAPSDLTRIAARNGGTFPRNLVMTEIDGFHRDVGFSDAMPEFGAGDMGPMIVIDEGEGNGTPVPLRLLELAEYLESIQEP